MDCEGKVDDGFGGLGEEDVVDDNEEEGWGEKIDCLLEVENIEEEGVIGEIGVAMLAAVSVGEVDDD
jgi:hypothetical protein